MSYSLQGYFLENDLRDIEKRECNKFLRHTNTSCYELVPSIHPLSHPPSFTNSIHSFLSLVCHILLFFLLYFSLSLTTPRARGVAAAGFNLRPVHAGLGYRYLCPSLAATARPIRGRRRRSIETFILRCSLSSISEVAAKGWPRMLFSQLPHNLHTVVSCNPSSPPSFCVIMCHCSMYPRSMRHFALDLA